MDNPSTVKEVIEALSKLPQDLPCLVRPKYYGNLAYWDDAPIKAINIAEMHPKESPKNVTFLV